jgi:predicted anti-sigma-YlaC factor YlaD
MSASDDVRAEPRKEYLVMNLKNLRRWAVAAVVANVGVTLLAAAVLPASAVGLLPVIGLVLPLLTTGVIDAAAQPRLQH